MFTGGVAMPLNYTMRFAKEIFSFYSARVNKLCVSSFKETDFLIVGKISFFVENVKSSSCHHCRVDFHTESIQQKETPKSHAQRKTKNKKGDSFCNLI